jgi:hypothetical protein
MSDKWKVFATDTYDYDQWQIGEYDTAEEAQAIAINKAGEMLRTDVEGPNGKRIGSYQGKQTTIPRLLEPLQAEIERLRFALINMTPDYEYLISDAADRGTYDEAWLEECRTIAGMARAALQPKEG